MFASDQTKKLINAKFIFFLLIALTKTEETTTTTPTEECSDGICTGCLVYTDSTFSSCSVCDYASGYSTGVNKGCKTIDNCIFGAEDGTCAQCKADYYPSKNECKKIENDKIDNCVLYDANLNCVQCRPMYYPETEEGKATCK